MEQEDYEIKLMKYKLEIQKKEDRIRHLLEEINIHKRMVKARKRQYEELELAYERLNNKFEANFAFHGYIKDVLDQTADLMENTNAVRE